MVDQRQGPPILRSHPYGQPKGPPTAEGLRVIKEGHKGITVDAEPDVAVPERGQIAPEPPALPEASGTAKPEAEPPTVPSVSSDETGGPAPASSIAPGRKVLAAGAGGGGIGVPLSVILAYHLPGIPTEVAVAYTGLLVAFLSFLAGYLIPAERG